jgi:ribosomal protein L17
MTELIEQYDTSAVEKLITDTKRADLEERRALLWHKPLLQVSVMENFSF